MTKRKQAQPQPQAPLSPESVENQRLKGLVATEGYAVLKQLAEALTLQYEGLALPDGSKQAQMRYANAAVMRKGFKLLFGLVEAKAKATQSEPSFVQQMLNATIDQPREVIREKEQL
jgi:hypothetical protein